MSVEHAETDERGCLILWGLLWALPLAAVLWAGIYWLCRWWLS